jgi:hypothetical protein
MHASPEAPSRQHHWAGLLVCAAMALVGCSGGANGAGASGSGSAVGGTSGGGSGAGSGVGIRPSDAGGDAREGAGLDATLESGGPASSTDASVDSGMADSRMADSVPFIDGALGADAADSSSVEVSTLWGTAPACASACGVGQKLCNYFCVSVDDPKYGCGSTTCDSCLLVGGQRDIPSGITSVVCASGVCAVGSCSTGVKDCNLVFSDGCEADFTSSATCGSCTNQCAEGQLCVDGVCTTVVIPPLEEAGAEGGCPFPKTDCSGICRDLTSDPSACGACGQSCGGVACEQGQCQVAPAPACDAGMASVCEFSSLLNFGSESLVCTPWWVDDPSAGCLEQWDNECVQGSCPQGYACANQNAVGVCQLVCPAGTFGTPPACSSCSADCGAGICVEGSCTTPAAIQFMTGLSSPSSIALDGANLYVVDTGGNSIWQVSKATGAKTLLASGQASPDAVASDGTFAYWTSNLGSAILRAAVGTSQAFSVLYSAVSPNQIAVDDISVYWADNDGLHSAPKAGGGTVTQLNNALGVVPSLVAADSSYFYTTWAFASGFPDPGVSYSLLSVSKTTGAVATLDTTGGSNPNDQLYGAAVNDLNVYFAENQPGTNNITPTPYPNTLWQVPKSGSGASAYRIPVTGITSMTADNCSVYWTSGTSVYRLTPGAAPPLALTTAAVTPGQIVVDDKYAYWVDKTWIGRVPK